MTTLDHLIKILHDGGFSCVVEKEGNIRTFTRRGVSDLYDLYTNEPENLREASVADKVIGRGAAAILAASGVKAVHADVISTSAKALLQQNGVAVTYVTAVPHIENRDHSGWCPLETRCKALKELPEMLQAITDFVTEMQAKSAAATAP